MRSGMLASAAPLRPAAGTHWRECPLDCLVLCSPGTRQSHVWHPERAGLRGEGSPPWRPAPSGVTRRTSAGSGRDQATGPSRINAAPIGINAAAGLEAPGDDSGRARRGSHPQGPAASFPTRASSTPVQHARTGRARNPYRQGLRRCQRRRVRSDRVRRFSCSPYGRIGCGTRTVLPPPDSGPGGGSAVGGASSSARGTRRAPHRPEPRTSRPGRARRRAALR